MARLARTAARTILGCLTVAGEKAVRQGAGGRRHGGGHQAGQRTLRTTAAMPDKRGDAGDPGSGPGRTAA